LRPEGGLRAATSAAAGRAAAREAMAPARDQRIDGDADPAERRNEKDTADGRRPAFAGPQCFGDREVPTRTTAGFVDPPRRAANVVERERMCCELVWSERLPGNGPRRPVPPGGDPVRARRAERAIAVVDEHRRRVALHTRDASERTTAGRASAPTGCRRRFAQIPREVELGGLEPPTS
jgi:hypothetical protein